MNKKKKDHPVVFAFKIFTLIFIAIFISSWQAGQKLLSDLHNKKDE